MGKELRCSLCQSKMQLESGSQVPFCPKCSKRGEETNETLCYLSVNGAGVQIESGGGKPKLLPPDHPSFWKKRGSL